MSVSNAAKVHLQKVKQIPFLLGQIVAVFMLVVLAPVSGEHADSTDAPPIKWPADLPVYDHIVIVMEENKDYDQIIDNPKAPYINGIVRTEGASFTRMFGEEHNSEGNYFWLFSGSNQNVGFTDAIPTEKKNPKYPFNTPNLGAALIAKGLSFKGYSEDLPEIGSKVNSAPAKAKIKPYARKHVPWISFGNVPNGTTIETSSNLRFKDFPSDPTQFKNLPTVAIIVPNEDNDMHNGQLDATIQKGDTWLKTNLDAYYQWAKSNNSLLIVTWDEGQNKKPTYVGLTNPFVEPVDQFRRNIQNHIPTFFAGAQVKPGNYSEGKGITHVNILRTIEAMYGLPRAGHQQPNAEGGGIRDDFIITDVFAKVK